MTHEALGKIPKRHSKELGYAYFSAEDVVEGCKEALIDNGIVFSVEDVTMRNFQYDRSFSSGKTKSVHYFVLQGVAVFFNIDDRTDFYKTAFYGSAEDDADKAIGKANSYAKKIALMNTLLIQDGEDTDSVKSQEGKNSASVPQNQEDKITFKVVCEDIAIQKFLTGGSESTKMFYRPHASIANAFLKNVSGIYEQSERKKLLALGFRQEGDKYIL